MSVVDIPRWAWLLIGIAVGAGAGYTRQSCRTGDFSGYGVQIKGQRRFETALLQEGDGGGRLFKNLIVYPDTVAAANGARTAVEVVAGKFFGVAQGIDQYQGSTIPSQWRDAYFVVEPPYRGSTSVTTYLDTLNAQGVSYLFAWWRRPFWWNALHVAAGVVTLGIVWPTVINLMAFGSWRRPIKQQVPELPPARPQAPPPAKAEPSMHELNAVVAAFDKALSATAVIAVPPPAPTRPAQPPVLSTLPLEPVGHATEAASKEFGSGREDFYPTELKPPKQKAKKP